LRGARPRHPAAAAAAGALALAGLGLACEAAPAPLDNGSCPCADGYTCCASENVCLRPGQICVDAGQWPASTAPATPLGLGDMTVFALSQVDTNSNSGPVDDPQLLALQPDMVVRAWAQWGHFGTGTGDFQATYIQHCQARGIRFMGGATATLLAEDQTVTATEFDDLSTRDASGAPVAHDDIAAGMRRATLANPSFRDYLVRVAEIQIDLGVDGLQFEEINGGYQGADYLGDEGFDTYHLADFNAYLMAKHPAGTDFAAMFDMTAANTLRHDVPAGDLAANFNYPRYLADHGWSRTPLVATNPLAAEWGRATLNRPAPGAGTFVDAAEPYHYWKEIVDRLRAYAHTQWNRDLLISAEGIYPFVDFQSVGLDDYNTDGPGGAVVSYLPTVATAVGARLDGTKSLQDAFLHLRSLSSTFAPGAPVVLFLDGRWDRYTSLPTSDLRDYWRLYGAEAYANGLFFAFQLKSSVGQPAEPTATDLGLMDLFTSLAGFYRGHASLYHGVVDALAEVSSSLPSAKMSVRDQAAADDPGRLARRIVHVVNHEYVPGAGIVTQQNVALRILSERVPTSVWLASPDAPADVPALPFTYDVDSVSVTLPSLDAYDVVVLEY
jgi:hypothetical protein